MHTATASSVARRLPSGASTPWAGGAPLTSADLITLVDEVAAATQVWSDLVAHDPDARSAVRLIGVEWFEVWLLGWTPGQRVDLHDHGPSDAALRVVQGTLTEVEHRAGGLCRRQLHVGSRRAMPSGTVHDVLNESTDPATSIHAYSPPLSAMTFYDATAKQPVRLERVEPAEPVLEGWPLSAVPGRVPR